MNSARMVLQAVEDLLQAEKDRVEAHGGLNLFALIQATEAHVKYCEMQALHARNDTGIHAWTSSAHNTRELAKMLQNFKRFQVTLANIHVMQQLKPHEQAE